MLTAGVLLFSQFAVVPIVGATDNHTEVTICHATGSNSNPFEKIGVDDDAVNGNGSSDHNRNDHQNGEDIIPPGPWDVDGRNWTTTNQAIWANDCETTRVEVKKVVVPASDAGLFNLKIEGTTYAPNVGNGGTTGEVYVDEDDNITVSETQGTNTSMSSYSTSITCRDKNGTGDVVKSGSATSVTIDDNDIKKGDDILCIITNTRKTGNLKVVKDVINDNGGTKTYADFTFKVDANDSPRSFDATTSPDGEKVVALPAGTNFSVSEVQANTNGYATSYSAGCSGTIVEGQTKVCTITNNDTAAQMRVKKSVTNNNGGNAVANDFTLSVNGQAKTQNQYFAATPGVKTVTESGPSGYAQTELTCVNDANQQVVAHPVNLGLGQSVTCTVTNDDVTPGLTVIKQVINDNGGTKASSDFTMNVTGTNVSLPSFPGNAAGTSVTLNSGTYSVAETSPNGYSASYSEDCSGSIALGQTKICTITNNDIPALLTVIKKVVNNNGGLLGVSDFPLFVNGTQVTSGVPNLFNAGSYTVSETSDPGYVASEWTGSCDTIGNLTMEIGGEYSCTITNDDAAPTLKIVKKTLSKDSDQEFEFASEELGDFTLEGGEHKFFSDLRVGDYTITEEATDGWQLNDMVCWNGEYTTDYEAGSTTVSLALGDHVICKFINEKLSQINGYKFNDVNYNGEWDDEEPTLEGWTITLTKVCEDQIEAQRDAIAEDCEDEEQSTVTDEDGYYSFENLQQGTYIVCEEEQAGWIQTYPGTDDGCYEVVIDCPDEDISRDFGNFQKGEVAGVKFNDVNGNHLRDQSESTLKNWEITLAKLCEVNTEELSRIAQIDECQDETWTTTTDVNGAYSFGNLMPGDYVVCETQQDKWTQTYPQTKDGCHEFTIATSGQVVEADFGNKAKPQVLGETTTTTTLVNTGASTGKSLAVGLLILSVLGAVHLLTRRKNYAQ